MEGTTPAPQNIGAKANPVKLTGFDSPEGAVSGEYRSRGGRCSYEATSAPCSWTPETQTQPEEDTEDVEDALPVATRQLLAGDDIEEDEDEVDSRAWRAELLRRHPDLLAKYSTAKTLYVSDERRIKTPEERLPKKLVAALHDTTIFKALQLPCDCGETCLRVGVSTQNVYDLRYAWYTQGEVATRYVVCQLSLLLFVHDRCALRLRIALAEELLSAVRSHDRKQLRMSLRSLRIRIPLLNKSICRQAVLNLYAISPKKFCNALKTARDQV